MDQTHNGPFILGLGQWTIARTKEEHEENPWHHNNDAGKQKYKTQTVKLSENWNGFLTFSTLNPEAEIFTGIPYKNGCFYTFTNEPSLSQCLPQKTSPFHSILLSPPGISLSNFISLFFVVNFLGHCDFLSFCSCRSFACCFISNFQCLCVIS